MSVSWSESGSTLQGFYAAVDWLSEHRRVINEQYRYICFVAGKKDETTGKQNWIIARPYKRMNEVVTNEGKPRYAFIPMGNVEFTNPEIEKEAEKTNLMLLFNGKMHLVSELSLRSLARRTGIDESTMKKSNGIELALYLSSVFDTDGYIKLLVQSDEQVEEVMCFNTPSYMYIKQDIIKKLISMFENRMPVGSLHVNRWNVSNEFTTVYIDFPEKAKEIAATYGLPESLVPGICISTSDMASSGLTIRGTYSSKDASSIFGHEEMIHSGKKDAEDADMEKLYKRVEENIISQYHAIPMALSKLLGVEITPAMSDASLDRFKTNKAKNTYLRQQMDATISNVFKQLEIVKAISKTREKSLREQLVNEFNFAFPHTGYELCMEIMNLSKPGRVEGLNRYMSERLSEACGRAPFVEYVPEKEDIILN